MKKLAGNHYDSHQRIDEPEEETFTRPQSEVYHSIEESSDEDDSSSRNSTNSPPSSIVSEDSLSSVKSTDERSILELATDDSAASPSPSSYPAFSEIDETVLSNDTLTTFGEEGETVPVTPETEEVSKALEEERETEILGKTGREMMRNVPEIVTRAEENSVTPVVLGPKDKDHEPTIGSVAVFSKGMP